MVGMTSGGPHHLGRHDALGDEMKRFEDATCAALVKLSDAVVLRLDGRCFSTYTRGFDRPYDMRIHESMVSTAADCVEHFSAATAYTQSDEISLIFAPHTEVGPSTVPFNGRVQKLVSVAAGYASARFNMHMMRHQFDPARAEQAMLRERVERCEAHFDARVFALPPAELVAYMRWRSVMDCKRNSISMLAQAHFPHSQLQGVDAESCVRMLAERKGVRWEDTPSFFRHGTFVKKEDFEKAAFNPKTQEHTTALRTRLGARSFEFDARGREEETVEWLIARRWPVVAGPDQPS